MSRSSCRICDTPRPEDPKITSFLGVRDTAGHRAEVARHKDSETRGASPTAVAESPPPPDSAPPTPGRPRLRAATALIILLGWIAAQFGGGLMAGVVIGFRESMRGTDFTNPGTLDGLQPDILLFGIVFGAIFGLVAVVLLARMLVGSGLSRRDDVDAAWVVGEWRHHVFAALVGGLVSMFAFAVYYFVPPPDYVEAGPLSELASNSALGLVVWLFLALLLAPITEELLFRGGVVWRLHTLVRPRRGRDDCDRAVRAGPLW